MKKYLFNFFVPAVAIGFFATACENKNAKIEADPIVTGVTVSPATSNIDKGEIQAFTATVTGVNNPVQTVTWSIDETDKNAATTINADGILTVAATENLSWLTVKATSTADNTKNGSATITINNIPPEEPPTLPDGLAAQIVSNIKAGWNLGNTLDCSDLEWLGANPTISQLETVWGNPVTTKATIDALKNAGFNAIRIPVSWAKCVDTNYNIRADWMDRVKEVVDYAVANDMYIFLNSHHDEKLFKFRNQDVEESLKAFKKIWEQIADTFKDYDEKLIFEGLNEPRTKGSPNEWSGGTTEEHNNVNSHYQVFVDVVRASGGNNNKRVLMINPYGASAEAIAMNGLKIPDDSEENRIIVSIHAYAPYDFALNKDSPVNTWSKNNPANTKPITDPLNRAYNTFINKGIPVIMGEFGAMNKNNVTDRVEWAKYYVNYAKSKGIPCFWWDNGVVSGDGERFGLLDRKTNTFTFPTIVKALTE